MKYHLKLTELQEQIIALVSNETKKGEVLTVMDVSNKLNIPYATAHDNLNILKHYNAVEMHYKIRNCPLVPPVIAIS